MAAIRRLNEREEQLINWQKVNPQYGLQAEIAIGMIEIGGVTVVSNNEVALDSHGLTEVLIEHFGRTNLDIVALTDWEARELAVRQPAFAIRRKILQK